MKPLAPNTMIQNRYLVVQAIGKGGMGEVYLAVDQRLGSAVALKRTFFNDDGALGGAFEREARILARLRHPVLPKVIDHFVENGDQFLVMEHISGDDLAKRLEIANKPFPLSWVMFWADQMLDALTYLHSHEPPIVHRDIKPQNLKLTDENHIVLLDFGLSKDFDTSTTGNPLNSASVAGYSPHFASMEQIRGTGTDPRSDIYSLSATLYQMLTNSIPSDALTRADALLGGGPDSIIPLNELNPDVSTAVSDVILKGCALRQEQRYSNAAEMQKALRRAFNQGTTEPDAEMLPASSGTEPLTGGPTTNPSEMATRAQVAADNVDFDATVQMDIMPVADPTPPEVPVVIAAPPVSAAPVISQPKVFDEAEQATRLRAPSAASLTAAASASAGTPVVSQAVVPPQPVQVKAPPPAAKAKSSKTGLIIGVIVGLIVLAGAAGGGAWYLYSGQTAAVAPTPMPTAVTTPTQNVVAETAPDANINSNTSAVQETAADNTNTDRVSPTGAAPRSAAGATTKTAPVRAAPAVKATPKPKARDERTVILQ